MIDADLQDPPEVIALMVEQWRQGFDVVYGVRSDRAGETRLKLATASMFYRLLGRLTNIHIPANVGDFRLMSRRVVDQLKTLREKDRFVRGLVSWVGFKQTGVTYQRDARYAGETKYPFRKMLKFSFDGITSFSTVPLKLATWIGSIDGDPRGAVPAQRLRPEAARLHGGRLGDDHGGDALHGQRPVDLPRHPRRVPRAGLQRGEAAPDVRHRGRIVVRWLMASSSPAAPDSSAAGF